MSRLGGAMEIGGVVVTIRGDTSQLRSAEGEAKAITARIGSDTKAIVQIGFASNAGAKLASDAKQMVAAAQAVLYSNPLRLPVVLDASSVRAQLSNLASGQSAPQISSSAGGVMLGGAGLIGYSAAEVSTMRQMGVGRMLPSPGAKWVNSRVIGNGSGGGGGGGGSGGNAAGAAGEDAELIGGAAMAGAGGKLAGEGGSLGLRGMVRGFFIAEAASRGLNIAAAGSEYSGAKRIAADPYASQQDIDAVEAKRQAYQGAIGDFPGAKQLGTIEDNGYWFRSARSGVAHVFGKMSTGDEEAFAKDQARQQQQMDVLKTRSDYLGGVGHLAAEGSLQMDREHAARSQSPAQRAVSDAKEALQNYTDTTVAEVKQANHGQVTGEVKQYMGKLQRAVDDATKDLIKEKQMQLTDSNAVLRAAGTDAYATIGSAYAGYVGATQGTMAGQRASLAVNVRTANQRAANDVATAKGPLDYAMARIRQGGTWIGGNLQKATLDADQKWISGEAVATSKENLGVIAARSTGDEGAARLTEIQNKYADKIRQATHDYTANSDVVRALTDEQNAAVAAQKKINDRNKIIVGIETGARIASANARAGNEDTYAGVLSTIGSLKAESRIARPKDEQGKYLAAELAELKADKAQLMRPTGYATEEGRFDVAYGGPSGYSGKDQADAMKALTDAVNAWTQAINTNGLPN